MPQNPSPPLRRQDASVGQGPTSVSPTFERAISIQWGIDQARDDIRDLRDDVAFVAQALERIAEKLGVSLGDLFESDQEDGPAVLLQT